MVLSLLLKRIGFIDNVVHVNIFELCTRLVICEGKPAADNKSYLVISHLVVPFVSVSALPKLTMLQRVSLFQYFPEAGIIQLCIGPQRSEFVVQRRYAPLEEDTRVIRVVTPGRPYRVWR